MDRKKNKIKKIVKIYIENMPGNIKVNGVFLFGSYATEKTRKDSDIDLIVISRDFKKIPFMERMILLSHIQGNNNFTRGIPMDIIGYTPEEFKNIDKESIIMRQAKREGRMIYSAS